MGKTSVLIVGTGFGGVGTGPRFADPRLPRTPLTHAIRHLLAIFASRKDRKQVTNCVRKWKGRSTVARATTVPRPGLAGRHGRPARPALTVFDHA